jgi:hypothetical protein
VAQAPASAQNGPKPHTIAPLIIKAVSEKQRPRSPG